MIRTALLTTCMAIAIGSTARPFEAPLGLQWAATHGECKVILAQGESELGKLSLKDPKEKFSASGVDPKVYPGVSAADLKGFKLFGEKAASSRIYFDSAGGLCGIEYDFIWSQDVNPSLWGFRGKGHAFKFHSDVRQALSDKYGEPKSDESMGFQDSDDIPDFTLLTAWQDTTDATILNLWLTKKKSILGASYGYIVRVLYQGPTLIPRAPDTRKL